MKSEAISSNLVGSESTVPGDGGPAFPIPTPDHQTFEPANVAELRRLASGMTLRDYFIAHAPAEPQRWFEPAMPPAPRVPVPYIDLERGTPLYVELVSHIHQGNTEYEDLSPAAQEWADMRKAAVTAFEAYERERAKQRYVQWPAAWADAMLAARGTA